VVIVSDNDETLDGLQEYLRGAGVAARGTRLLRGPMLERRNITAVVLFPDDFAKADVASAVTRLLRLDVLLVLVTGDPARFEAPAASAGAVTRPVVIPRPAWGWTILDTILGRLEA